MIHKNKIKDVDYYTVVGYFNCNKKNDSPTIAKYLKMKLQHVDYILNVYLSRKKNSYVEEVETTYAIDSKFTKAVNVYDEDDTFLVKFSSLRYAAECLKVSEQVISKNMGGDCVNHYNGKKYRYELAQ